MGNFFGTGSGFAIELSLCPPSRSFGGAISLTSFINIEHAGWLGHQAMTFTALPADPSKASLGTRMRFHFGTRKPLKQYHPAKANNARHRASRAPVWLLSNFFQNGSGR
jgi:hypothetical protein